MPSVVIPSVIMQRVKGPLRCNDTQHNDTQHKDIQHNDTQHNTKQNATFNMTLSIMVLVLLNTESHLCFMLLLWVSWISPLCWVSLWWMSLCWESMHQFTTFYIKSALP